MRGTHYTRGPGPESVAISRPKHWAPVIRRCVLHERQALLADLATQIYESRPDLTRDQILDTCQDDDGAEVPADAADDPVALWLQAKVRTRVFPASRECQTPPSSVATTRLGLMPG